MPRGVPLNFSRSAEAARLYEGGSTIEEITQKMRLSYGSVRKYLDFQNIQVRKGNGNAFARGIAPNVSHVKGTQWAYLAGVIDGEGCIRALCVKRSGDHNNFHSVLVVTQRDPAILDWVERTITGVGRFKTHTRRKTGITYRRWLVTCAEEILAVLAHCLPYLTLKHSQAQLAITLSSQPRPSLSKQEELAGKISKLKTKDYL